jgi:hypothetical protein
MQIGKKLEPTYIPLLFREGAELIRLAGVVTIYNNFTNFLN